MKTLKNIPFAEILEIHEDDQKQEIVSRLPGFGRQIPNSRFFRTFCIDCHTPMRVHENHTNMKIRCEQCDPKHVGCTSPETRVNNLENDIDAFRPSWRCA